MTDVVAATPGFGEEDGARLDALLAAVFTADADDGEPPPGWLDAAGFLFAVACAPGQLLAEEWLEALLTPQDDPRATVDPASDVAVLLQRLLATIAAGVDAGTPQPPAGWIPRPDPLDNFASAAPLAQWARGFERGHWWLAGEWDVRLPAAVADVLDACHGTLAFFADPDEAAGTVLAVTGDPDAAADYARAVIEGFTPAMEGYAAVGVMLGDRKAAAAQRAREVAARAKRARRAKVRAQKRSRKANRR